LRPRYFYNDENASIYWAIQELYKEGVENIDAYNLSTKLQSNKGVRRTLEKFNLPSMQEIIELYKGAARHTLTEYKMYADNIVSLAFKRDLINALDALKVQCFNRDTNLGELSNIVYGELDNLTRKYIVDDEIHTIGDKIDDIWEEIKSRRSEDGVYGIPSKFASFSEYFTYEPGELVLVQAKYKQGKSALLMNEAIHKVQNGVATLIVDTEMSTRLYTERLIAHLANVSVKKVKSGKCSDEENRRISDCLEWLKTQPLVHIYDPNMTMEKLYSICKILKRSIGLGFVVYDYLKFNDGTSSEIYNVLGARCDYLKNKIAGELDLPVLSAAQLNRQGEIADSMKINMYLSVGVKWGYKTQAMQINDGVASGNMYAKIYINRLGEQMQEDDEDDYIDFMFTGDTMTIEEAEPHNRETSF